MDNHLFRGTLDDAITTNLLFEIDERKREMSGLLPLLGEVPLHADICELSDSGKPVVVAQPDSPFAGHYRDITSNILSHLKR